ncbi:leukocyte immunoglobulin-like receptor subfamily A member 5 [Hippopotamus amphibius kiboko]|uniref:leukocyte immunoglobulin-like receptor subfamily A member 5 n=1 Tax=Hippopotamus amphibius kiboko TaxID=575201 RepID=UPI0025979DF0|nr:leukocyte immunoglobulin-like receptor subfamily A member 5 [Hippopotamus amphibius kiboko]
MSVVLPTLFYLGLYLGQSTQAQKGNRPPPLISALPGSIVPRKNPVTILCEGPEQAEGYRISKVGSPEPTDRKEEIISRKTNTLNITEMTTDLAGLYHCSYQKRAHWSQFSDPLQLVMTGAYDKPSLSSIAGTVVAPGENVTLQCFSKLKFNVFMLTEEDGVHIPQNQSTNPQDKGYQAIFLLNQVSSTQTETYRCYGVFSQNPYLWSLPSDQLQLQVKEVPDHLSTTEPRRSTALPHNPTSQERPLGILIGVPVATGLLLLIFLLLFILRCCHKAKNNAARKERQPEVAGPVNGQVYETIDPQEVTYSQLTCSVPHQRTAGTPSLVPTQTQTSEYATIALK